jgi:bifunctional isochorismate lyase/aryl carrier protein
MDDIQSFFIGDAVADFSSEKHKMAIEYASQRCAYTALTNEVLELLAGSADGEEKTSAALTKERMREQIAAILQESPSDILDQEDLLDRGLDSVRIMSLVEQWRRDGAEVTFVELAENPTLEEWWRLLSSRSQKVLPNADYL